MPVVFQQPAQSLTTLQRALTRCVLVDRRKEQDIVLALMIPLVMIMLHVLVERMPEGGEGVSQVLINYPVWDV